jgi:CheY-like chemotaxis protein
MRITSEIGKGTVVNLWLPRAKNALTDTGVKREEPPDHQFKNLRILLVDDDALVSMGAMDMLMDLGHNVVEAPSAEAAFRLLESEPPFDVVVTDYAMPGMNGLDLGIEIQKLNPKLPVLLATGYAELPSDRTIPFRRLAKPYTQQDLAKALEALFVKT